VIRGNHIFARKAFITTGGHVMKFTPPRQKSPTPEPSSSQPKQQPTQQSNPQPTQQPSTQALQPRRPALQPAHPAVPSGDFVMDMPGAFEGSSREMVARPSLRGGAGTPGDVADVSFGDMVSKARKGVTGPLKRVADVTLGFGKDATLSKQTSAWSSVVFSKSKSTISEPMTMAGKAGEVFRSVVNPERARVAPAPALALKDGRKNLPPETLALPATQALSTVHCKALTNRLDQATRVLDALALDTTTRKELHELTTSKLKATTFPVSALAVKLISGAYRDRQVTGVLRSREARIEQGIKTLNLAHEAAQLHAEVAPAVGTPAAASALGTAAAGLNTTREGATNRLANFGQRYADFVYEDLGQRITADVKAKIDRIADVGTSPSDRNKLHTEVMARAIAAKRVDEALGAVADVGQRDALRARIDALPNDADPLRVDSDPPLGDREIIDLVHELTNPDPAQRPAGADQFLQRMTEMKGAPLDETLRVSRGAYRAAYTVRPPGENVSDLDKWKDVQAQDMETVNTELTSIALHVRQASCLGTLDNQLAAAFPHATGQAVPPERAQIKQNFEDSCARLVQRPPGDPVSAQDKVNIKLAKCILDNGAGIHGIAKDLQYLQESYATDLDHSPDMKKLLSSGSTGASYDPVEQQKNAGARLKNLRMGILDFSQSAGERYVVPAAVSADEIRRAIDAAEEIVGRSTTGMSAEAQAKAGALERHLFLMKNYVREQNADNSLELLTQLADNDPRCGTDAVMAENATVYGNLGASAGIKPANPRVSLGAGLDITAAGQWPAPNALGLSQRNRVHNNIVLTESTAYSIKSVCNLKTTSYKGTLKAGGAMGFAASEQEAELVKSALAVSVSGALGFERVVIENPEPGLACMVHKAPVLDGTAKNAKISDGTYIGMNDAVNRALFQKVQVDGVTPVASDMSGWDNLNHFFAATDRATLEPLTKREVTLTLTDQVALQVGGSFSGTAAKDTKVSEGPAPTLPKSSARQGLFAGRVAVGVDTKFGHSFRDEQVRTTTLEKVTLSDALSETRTATAGTAVRVAGALPADGGATYVASRLADAALSIAKLTSPEAGASVQNLTELAKKAHDVSAAMPKMRLGSQIDLAKVSRGLEQARDYKEDYKRVVRDQFGNEIPALVRDSRTTNDGRLLVNNIVNEVGLLNATMAQRINDTNMSVVEKQTLTKLLCLSTIASHYQNAGALGGGDLPNDNLTINVTASLSPAAAARHAAVKGGFGRAAAEGEQAAILANSLNYQTLGAAGGFKNQNTKVTTNGAMARTMRAQSSAQSAGYPSGVDVISAADARRFDTFLRDSRNSDVREALQSAGMGEPLKLLADYNAIAHPELPPIDPTPEPVIEEAAGDEDIEPMQTDLEAGNLPGDRDAIELMNRAPGT
jgi:hypothetical protein